MKRALSLLLAAALLAPAAGAEAKRRPLPTYAHALRCAGLTGAWSREPGLASAEALRRFDASLFWGLAASEVARRTRPPAARMEADTPAALERAQAELARPGAAAAAARRELAACVAEVPPLTRRKR